MKNKHRHRQGFGLIEVLVSVAVISVVLVGLISTLTYSIKSNNQAQIRTAARDQAQAVIDYFRAERAILGYEGLREVLTSEGLTYCLNQPLPTVPSKSVDDNNIASHQNGSCSNYGFSIEGISADFKREVEVALSDPADPDAIGITVTIEWQSDVGGVGGGISSVVARSELKRW